MYAIRSYYETRNCLLGTMRHRHHDPAETICRNASHHVVGRRINRYWSFDRVYMGEAHCQFANTRQAFLNDVRAKMIQFEQHVILLRPAATALAYSYNFV